MLIGVLTGLMSLYSVATASPLQPRIVGGTLASPEAWPFMAALMQTAAIYPMRVSAGSIAVTVQTLSGALPKPVSGVLMDCGLASAPCTGAQGRICLIERGDNLFVEKVENCARGGGLGAVIYNNLDGDFAGAITGSTVAIPAVAASRAEGLTLRGLLGQTVALSYNADSGGAKSFCGASYLGGGWILTAAHCLEEFEANELFVAVGGGVLTDQLHTSTRAARLYIHPDYSTSALDNDIGLIRLSAEPPVSAALSAVDAATLDAQIAAAAMATIIGRGTTEALVPQQDSTTPTVTELLQVEVPLVSQAVCQTAYANAGLGPTNPVTANMFCAGLAEGGKDSCTGDSGGPLLVQGNGQWVQAGIVSWSLGCAQPEYYGVYTRVPRYAQYIADVRAGVFDGGSGGGGALGWLGLLLGAGAIAARARASRLRIGLAGPLAMGVAMLLGGCTQTLMSEETPLMTQQSRIEPLYAYRIHDDVLEITVASTGCTREMHFDLVFEPRAQHCTVTVMRTQVDPCRRAVMPAHFTLPLKLPEACRGRELVVLNPLREADGAPPRVPELR
ncbi:MAG: trypsin-like serine protease [Thiotrichales bacterium]